MDCHVAPNGRPVRKALVLALALFMLVDLPLNLLSASLDDGPPEHPRMTADLVGTSLVTAPLLESLLVVGVYVGASALARSARLDPRHAGAARLLSASVTGAAMAALHTPHSLLQLLSVTVFFFVQALQYAAWRRDYDSGWSYTAVAATHFVNNALIIGLALPEKHLG